MTKSEFLELFGAEKIVVLSKIRDNFVLRELYEVITDFGDLENSDVVNFLNTLGTELGRDLIAEVRNKKRVINKYVVPTQGKSVDEILRIYGSKHTGNTLWVGNIGVDTIELYVADGELIE
jgi:hypothetical protein